MGAILYDKAFQCPLARPPPGPERGGAERTELTRSGGATEHTDDNAASGPTRVMPWCSPLTKGLLEGSYSVDVSVVDAAGNGPATATAGFSVDTTPPAAPSVADTPDTVGDATLNVSGSKEAGAAITVNGGEVVAADEKTSWDTALSLQQGDNVKGVKSRYYRSLRIPSVL